jgi:hypothetical protein
MANPYDRKRAAVFLLAILTFAALSVTAEQPEIVVGAFSSAPPNSIPQGWRPWILKNVGRRTAYKLVRNDSQAVKAVARNSASGLKRDLRMDPREYPIIQWRWKIAGVIGNADISRKESNDSPARLYVAFDYDISQVGFFERLKYAAAKRIYSDSLPLRALAYTWANRTSKDQFVPMPYTSWFVQVVVENDTSPVNEWVTEERDVCQDYKAAFGEDPRDVTGVAIMTNTDNLHGEAVAWYGDIIFRKNSIQ